MTVEQSLAPVPAPAAPPGAARRALSPSRAADFKTCPLLYRFRSIDRLPERPTPEQVRGTLVHAVLERLFDAPAPQRTPRLATTLVEPQWHRLTAERTELAGLFEGDAERELLASTGDLLRGYFAVEDPRRLDPAERESLVQVEIDGSLLLRGYVDRLDVSPDGDLRVVDYKTGGAPSPAAALPQGRRGVRLHPRRRRSCTVRAHPAGAVAGHRAGRGRAHVPAEAEPAVRLVQPPGAVSRVWGHAAGVPRRRRQVTWPATCPTR